MSKLFSVQIDVQANSQQEAERKVRTLISIGAGYRPSVWELIFFIGSALLPDRKENSRSTTTKATSSYATNNAKKRDPEGTSGKKID